MLAGQWDVHCLVSSNHHGGAFEDCNNMGHGHAGDSSLEHVDEVGPADVIMERKIWLCIGAPLIVEQNTDLDAQKLRRAVSGVHDRGFTYIEENLQVFM